MTKRSAEKHFRGLQARGAKPFITVLTYSACCLSIIAKTWIVSLETKKGRK